MSVSVTQRPRRTQNGSGRRAVVHLSVEERAARGKAARAEVRRRAHGEWKPAARGRDPVDLLEAQAESRVAELVPIRYGRMLVSPFTFFRGGAFIMAPDLAGEPRTDLQVQLCGDAHLSNFGAFAAPDRRLVFSLNDFDETLPGPVQNALIGTGPGSDSSKSLTLNTSRRSGAANAPKFERWRRRTTGPPARSAASPPGLPP